MGRPRAAAGGAALHRRLDGGGGGIWRGLPVLQLHAGPQIDLIQGAAPNEFRGRFITFVLMISYAGIFLGPFAVGVPNDQVFGGGAGIRWSAALTFVVSSAAAALCWAGAARLMLALQQRRQA